LRVLNANRCPSHQVIHHPQKGTIHQRNPSLIFFGLPDQAFLGQNHPEKNYRQLGTRFDQAYPITKTVLTRLLATCCNDLHGLRDRTLLLVSYDSMRRRSELTSLCVENVEWHAGDGATILLRKSKTDQHGSGKCIHLQAETTLALH
jgi:integrase